MREGGRGSKRNLKNVKSSFTSFTCDKRIASMTRSLSHKQQADTGNELNGQNKAETAREEEICMRQQLAAVRQRLGDC